MRHLNWIQFCLGVGALSLIQTSSALALPPATASLTTTSEVTPSAKVFTGTNFIGSPHCTAHQQDGMTVAFGYRWVVYYDQDKKVCLARKQYDPSEQPWETITFSDTATIEDTHRTPQVGISQDGCIHINYDQMSSPLRYRVSSTGAAWAATLSTGLFASERDWLKSGSSISMVTYPRFVRDEDRETFYMFWMSRDSANPHLYASRRHFAKYDNSTQTWGNTETVIDGLVGTYDGNNIRHGYFNDICTFDEKIYLTWCWRENTNALSNHDILYAYTDNEGASWKNAAGSAIGSTASPINLNTTGILAVSLPCDLPQPGSGPTWRLTNQNACAVDNAGTVHVIVIHGEDNSGTSDRHYYHYFKTTTGSWSLGTEIPCNLGSRPKLYIDRDANTLYMVSRFNNKFQIQSAQPVTDHGNGTYTYDWGHWETIYTGTTNYISDGNGRLSDDGTVLRMVAQRPASGGATSSSLHLLEFALDDQKP